MLDAIKRASHKRAAMERIFDIDVFCKIASLIERTLAGRTPLAGLVTFRCRCICYVDSQ